MCSELFGREGERGSLLRSLASFSPLFLSSYSTSLHTLLNLLNTFQRSFLTISELRRRRLPMDRIHTRTHDSAFHASGPLQDTGNIRRAEQQAIYD